MPSPLEKELETLRSGNVRAIVDCLTTDSVCEVMQGEDYDLLEETDAEQKSRLLDTASLQIDMLLAIQQTQDKPKLDAGAAKNCERQ